MNMQKLLATTAVAAFVFGSASASATVVPAGSVDVTYTTSTSNLIGNAPTITDNLASGFIYTQSSGLSQQSFLTTSPAGSSPGNYAQEQINFTFTFTDHSGATGTLSTFAIYYANYSAPPLGCDPNPVNQANSDCIIWNGSPGSKTSFGSPPS